MKFLSLNIQLYEGILKAGCSFEVDCCEKESDRQDEIYLRNGLY